MDPGLGLALVLWLGPPAQATAPDRTERPRCEDEVVLAVRAVQDGRVRDADERLSAALRRCPRNPEVLRESAALRFRQGRLDEAQELALRLLDEEPDSAWAWDLIGSTRYVRDDRRGALEAWNRVGRPLVREVRISAASPSRGSAGGHPAVGRALGFGEGDLITPSGLVRAERALAAIPAVTRARVDFRAEREGAGSVEAAVTLGHEHPFEPEALPAHVLRGLAGSVRLAASNPFGLMERWDVVGMADGRLRSAGASVAYPGSLGRGVAAWELSWSDGRFAGSGGEPVRLVRAGLAGSYRAWLSPAVRWGGWAGVDRWSGTAPDGGGPAATFARLGAEVRFDPPGPGRSVRVSGEGWTRGGRVPGFGRASLRAERGYALREDTDLELHAGVDAVSRRAPLDLYPRFGAGRSATRPMRARSVFGAEGEVRPVRSGSAWTHGGVELRRWMGSPTRLPAGALSIGAALFVDAMRTVRASEADGPAVPAGAVHVGMGLRARVPGAPGWFRIDWAVDPADGASRLSAAWVPGS